MSRRQRLLKGLLLAVLAVAVAAALSRREEFTAAQIRIWLDHLGPWAPVGFIALYALATVLFLPGSVLTLAGGALFGAAAGTLYNLTGATLGATAAFVIARYSSGEWVRRRAGPRLSRLLEGVEAEGWRFVAFVRLVPLFPFNLLNYALGLTRIPLVHYALTSFVTMAPGAFAYTYLGYVGREAVTGGEDLVQKALLALGLLAAAVFLPLAVRRWRRTR